jgi:alanine racemase
MSESDARQDVAGAHAAVLTVDLAALAANYRDLARHVAPAECAAVVKADAYGLGAAAVAPALAAAGCRTFFVATLAEGVALRAVLPGPRIFVFEGPAPADAATYLAARLGPVLNSLDQIDTWRAAASHGRAAPAPCAIQIDTGMARLGLSEAEVAALAEAPARLEALDIALVMSHLACAEDRGAPINADQRARFDALRARLPAAPASLANSAGCRLGRPYHYDLVRPGIALYGGYAGGPGGPPMRPVAQLVARILQVRLIDTPQTVGYGATYAAAGPTRVATLGLGYADGYKRALGNRGRAALAGRLVPVLGRVSMDLVTVDVTGLPDDAARPGAAVELLGASVPLDAVAEAAGTIPHDVLTGLGRRPVRHYAR